MSKATLAGLASVVLVGVGVRSAEAVPVFAVNTTNQLFSFDSAAPDVILSGVGLGEGLASNEQIVAIDFRPSTGQLFGLGSSSRVYIIDPATGDATQVGPRFPLGSRLSGSAFGIDFNPTVDRLRIVSDADQNLRFNPNDGSVLVDSNLNYPSSPTTNPNVVATAYTINALQPGTGATTTQYAIDSDIDTLSIVNPPNAGVLTPVLFGLGVDTSNLVGFDIAVTGEAFASLQPAIQGVSNFYRINLATGQASIVDRIGGGQFVRSIAVVIPEPGSAMALIGLAGFAMKRRRA